MDGNTVERCERLLRDAKRIFAFSGVLMVANTIMAIVNLVVFYANK